MLKAYRIILMFALFHPNTAISLWWARFFIKRYRGVRASLKREDNKKKELFASHLNHSPWDGGLAKLSFLIHSNAQKKKFLFDLVFVQLDSISRKSFQVEEEENQP